MALPKIDLPIYELTLPSTKEKIKYRPFTVKEEKILLVAQESDDAEQELLAAKQVINNCLQDKDVSELAMFDLEYVLLILRSKSVDNNISFGVRDPDTDETVNLEIDIENVKITNDENHSNEVRINDDFVLYLKYPTIEQFIDLVKMDPNDPLTNYFMMIWCLDKVASDDEVHSFKDYTQEETDQFMDNISGSVVKGIERFFMTMPKLRHEMKYTNKNGDEKTFVIEGMRSFFI